VKSAHTVGFALLAAMIATLAATPAEAQSSRRNYRGPTAYDSQANPHYGFGRRVPVQPNDVVTGGRIIGRDPDPFIRGELLRHYNSGWPDP
jgi:hypothetical protein